MVHEAAEKYHSKLQLKMPKYAAITDDVTNRCEVD